MNPSLIKRLLLVSSLVLVGFLGTTGLALDQAFRNSLDASRTQRMEALLYTLLAAASLEEDGLVVEPPLADARFRTLESGLYARILDEAGRTVWRSQSLMGQPWSGTDTLRPGEQRWHEARAAGEPVLVLSYGLEWEDPAVGAGHFTVQLAEALSLRQAELQAYRQGLWGWLLGAAAALLLAQALIQRWGLAPLRRVAAELDAIRQGKRQSLGERYPSELLPLTRSLNRLLKAERERGTRYRQTLADLAHSLKTPLAVLRSRLEADPDKPPPPEVIEQIERMDSSLQYHLGRASRAGRAGMGEITLAAPVIQRLRRAISVPADRDLQTEVHCQPDARFPGPEVDLMELLGNLLDNASKWAASRIRLTVDQHQERQLTLVVEDDGPGIPETLRAQVLERGVRGDQTRPGQGLGLAVVRDLVNDYEGDLTIAQSPLGGASLRVRLPLRHDTLSREA